MSRREPILERQLRPCELDLGREKLGGDLRRRVPHQIFAREVEHVPILFFRLQAPAFEGRQRMNVCGQAFRVERRDRLVVDQDVLAPGLVFEFGDVGHQLPVVGKKRPLRGQRAGYERLANEHVARRRWIDGAKGNRPPRHQRQSVQRHALGCDHLAAPFLPMRFEMIAGHPLARDLLDPLGLDPGRATRKEPRRFREFGGKDPLVCQTLRGARALPRQSGTGMQVERKAARAEVMEVGIGLDADIAE